MHIFFPWSYQPWTINDLKCSTFRRQTANTEDGTLIVCILSDQEIKKKKHETKG